jgi:hypothetical protein
MLAEGGVAAESPWWLYKRGRYVVSIFPFLSERAFCLQSLSPIFRLPCLHGFAGRGQSGVEPLVAAQAQPF